MLVPDRAVPPFISNFGFDDGDIMIGGFLRCFGFISLLQRFPLLLLFIHAADDALRFLTVVHKSIGI
jgi:hypothetical protein